MTPRRIAIVPHSHWDREWYKSYQDFRLNLVDMLDVLLPLLEADASYPYFMLDGQMAVVRSAAFGGAMDVGYLPDMFGHIAQMPQILHEAGFAHAVVWRGVPSTVTKDAFA